MFRGILAVSTALLLLSDCQDVEDEELKKIGDPCGNGGTCKLKPNCPLEEELMTVDYDAVEICGADEKTQLAMLCCDEHRTTTPSLYKFGMTKKSVAEKKCEEYSRFVYVKKPSILNPHTHTGVISSYCASDVEALISGGKPALPKEFPHIAEIGYGVRSVNESFQCGGSLISDRWVLSAAHCSNVKDIGRPTFARIGDLDNKRDDDGAYPVVVNIDRIVNHPDYVDGRIYHDIALYRLEKPVTFNPYIRPLCLQVKQHISRVRAIAIGFGHRNEGGDYYNYLQKVDLNLVGFEKCYHTHGEYSALPNGVNDTTMLCAGNVEGKDTCKGDSGSSLSVRLRTPYCMFSQIGITSFGKHCGSGEPGVYTRVSYYVPWVEEIVWPEEAEKNRRTDSTESSVTAKPSS